MSSTDGIRIGSQRTNISLTCGNTDRHRWNYGRASAYSPPKLRSTSLTSVSTVRRVRNMKRDDPDYWQRIADAVLGRLEEHFLQQVDLAERSGVGEDTISKIVNVRQMSYRDGTLKALARALGWPAEALFWIGDGADPRDVPEVPPEGPGVPVIPKSGYDARISHLSPHVRQAIDDLIEADEIRRGTR